MDLILSEGFNSITLSMRLGVPICCRVVNYKLKQNGSLFFNVHSDNAYL